MAKFLIQILIHIIIWANHMATKRIHHFSIFQGLVWMISQDRSNAFVPSVIMFMFMFTDHFNLSLRLFMQDYMDLLIEWQQSLFPCNWADVIQTLSYNKLTWIRCIQITNLVENPFELRAIKGKIFNYIHWYLYSIDFDRFSAFSIVFVAVTFAIWIWFKQSLCRNSFGMRI